jgi:hypothetical protein
MQEEELSKQQLSSLAPHLAKLHVSIFLEDELGRYSVKEMMVGDVDTSH